MATWHYKNASGDKTATSTKINMCRKKGPMSYCVAYNIPDDQQGCDYREPASSGDACLHYRPNLDGACDNPWAQAGVKRPKKEG